METNRPDFFNEEYNDESNLIESLYEFHPDYFSDLTPDEFATLQMYYLFTTDSTSMPTNIFAYRTELLRRDPHIEALAKAIYKKVLIKAGIVEQNYAPF